MKEIDIFLFIIAMKVGDKPGWWFLNRAFGVQGSMYNWLRRVAGIPEEELPLPEFPPYTNTYWNDLMSVAQFRAGFRKRYGICPSKMYTST